MERNTAGYNCDGELLQWTIKDGSCAWSTWGALLASSRPALICPERGGENVRVVEYNFGRCRETGYHDAGERYECPDRKAYGDADELELEDEPCNS
jgi:hypothetical protein